MERRIDKKRVVWNVLTVIGLIFTVLLVVYVFYIAGMQESESVPTSDLAKRGYASESGDVQLYFYEDEYLFRDGEIRETFEAFESEDGILTFRTEAGDEEYRFLFLTGDRLFYDNGREVLYLIWYDV